MRGDLPTTDGRAALTDLEAALDGPLTALTPGTGAAVAERWQQACLADADLDLSTVAAGLGDLRDLLTAGALDGPAIARTLAGLADATRVAAANAGDDRVRPRLERIATNLDRGASALGGG